MRWSVARLISVLSLQLNLGKIWCSVWKLLAGDWDSGPQARLNDGSRVGWCKSTWSWIYLSWSQRPAMFCLTGRQYNMKRKDDKRFQAHHELLWCDLRAGQPLSLKSQYSGWSNATASLCHPTVWENSALVWACIYQGIIPAVPAARQNKIQFHMNGNPLWMDG